MAMDDAGQLHFRCRVLTTRLTTLTIFYRAPHSGLPLRAKTGIYSYSAKLLAPGLAGARRNPFWVYFWLKSARGRRSKKMAVFFMVEGPIFGHFSPNLDLRRPKCRENSERPRFRSLSGHFSGV